MKQTQISGGGMAAHNNILAPHGKRTTKKYPSRLIRSCRLGIMTCLAIVTASVWPSTDSCAQGATSSRRSVYMLVVDRSGSMTDKLSGGFRGPTRWQKMLETAGEFVRLIPLESEIRIITFNHGIASDDRFFLDSIADRDKAVKFIGRSLGRPGGGTHLYDTAAAVLDIAENIAQESPNIRITIRLYTDGKDETSRNYTQAQIEARFREKNIQFPGLMFYQTQIDPSLPTPFSTNVISEQSFERYYIDVDVAPAKIRLQSPAVHPVEKIKIVVRASAEAEQLFNGKTAALNFTSSGPVMASLDPSGIPIKSATNLVTLTVQNPKALDVAKAYEGVISISYPETDTHIVDGIKQIEVAFEKVEPPPLALLQPTSRVFPANYQIYFQADTLQAAQVIWNFGNGSSAEGPETYHAYSAPGEVTVQAEARLDKVGSTKTNFTLKIIDVSVALEPPSGTFYVGDLVTFACIGQGGIQRYEWLIDDMPDPRGALRQDGKEGSQLSRVFDEDGDKKVQVRGYADKATVLSSAHYVRILPKPSVDIVQPPSGAHVAPGESTLFVAQIKGGIEQVEWKLVDTNNNKVVAQAISPVNKNEGTAQFEFLFPVELGEWKGSAQALGIVKDASNQPKSEIPIVINYPIPQLAIVEPAQQGKRYLVGEKVVFRAESAGPVGKVVWTIESDQEDEVVAEGLSTVRKDETAEYQFEFPESKGEWTGRVRAKGELKAGAKGVPPEFGPVSFGVQYPPTGVKITAPLNQAEFYFRKPIDFSATVMGPVAGVQWEFSSSEGVQLPQGKAGERIQCQFQQRRGQKEAAVEVRARGKLKGIGKEPVSDPLRINLKSPPLNPRILLPKDQYGEERTRFGYKENISFSLATDEPLDDAEDIQWDFGDGSMAEGNPNPSHSYADYKDYTVSVSLRSKWSGERESASPRMITVGGVPPRAALVIVRGSKQWESDINVAKGGSVLLKDVSTGDVAKRALYAISSAGTNRLAEGEVPIEYNYPCDESGPITFELRVEGPGGADPSGIPIVTRTIRVRNYLIFWLFAVLAAILYGVIFALYSGDAPRYWRIYYCQNPGDTSDPTNLRWGASRPLAQYWSRLHNVAVIPLAKLFPVSKHWKSGAGNQDTLEVRGVKSGRIQAANLTVSSRKNPSVQWAEVVPNEVYRLVDSRAEESDPYRDLFFRVTRKLPGSTEILAKVALLILFAGMLVAIWFMI